MPSLNGLDDDDVMPLEERFRKVSAKSEFQEFSQISQPTLSSPPQGLWIPGTETEVQEDRLQHVSRGPQQLQDEEQQGQFLEEKMPNNVASSQTKRK